MGSSTGYFSALRLIETDFCYSFNPYNAELFLFNPVSAGNRLYTSQSEVCRRQIVMHKVDLCTEMIKIGLIDARRPITYEFK